ncbi:MAG: YabP/YqfC family sporulation protein [Clostridia bacterium]|nr:YabP/YqfC family sporulation protein [Clostridia bacterium]
MSFYDEVEKLFNLDEFRSEFSLCLVSMSALVVNGYEKIISFSESEIVLKCYGGLRVLIKGAKLVIKKLAKSELVINGELLAVERLGG